MSNKRAKFDFNLRHSSTLARASTSWRRLKMSAFVAVVFSKAHKAPPRLVKVPKIHPPMATGYLQIFPTTFPRI
jgi:hypothetical protein